MRRLILLVVLAALAHGCRALWPPAPPPATGPRPTRGDTPVTEVPSSATPTPPVVEAAAPARAGAVVRVLEAGSDEYQALPLEGIERSDLDAPLRLVVLHDGVPVLDRGLLRDDGAGEVERIDDAVVAGDGSAAAILTSIPDRGDVRTVVTWIPAAQPDSGWRMDIERDMVVRNLVVLPGARGVAIVSGAPEEAANLHLIGPDGETRLALDARQGVPLDLRTTPGGGVIAVDVAFPPAIGGSDRGILVVNLERGTSWSYGWSYGGETEPLSWELREDGTLDVTTAQGRSWFDTSGKKVPIRVRRPRPQTRPG